MKAAESVQNAWPISRKKETTHARVRHDALVLADNQVNKACHTRATRTLSRRKERGQKGGREEWCRYAIEERFISKSIILESPRAFLTNVVIAPYRLLSFYDSGRNNCAETFETLYI